LFVHDTLLTPQEGTQESIKEKSLTADSSAGTNASVLLGMQGVEQSAINEIGGPNHGWRGNKETTGNASNRESDKLGRHNYKPLI